MESLLDFRMAQTLTTEAALGLHSQHPDRQIEILRKDSRPALIHEIDRMKWRLR